MKDNPLAQAVRENKPAPFDMARMMQMIEEIHRAVVQAGPKEKSEIITTQQSNA